MPRLPKNKLEALKTWQDYSTRVSRFSREAQAKRLAETRRLFGTKVLVGDLHTHSTYSDGIGTVKDNWEMAKAAGFDFMFASDHGTIAQKRLCREKGHWWGQEPGLGGHHICLLAGSRKFTPRQDGPKADFERALKIAPFVFIPHPAGWFPGTWYPEERIRQLDGIERPFAVEVINGANKLDRAYDEFDAAAIRAWDRLLSMGRRITAVGASDAHLPQALGCVWTGVIGATLRMNSVIGALQEGHCFASEGPFLMLKCGRRMMGDTLAAKKGTKLTLQIEAADAKGLHSIRLVSGGRVVANFPANDRKALKVRHTVTFKGRSAYFRAECTALDDRRAFSTPLYVERA